MATIIATKAIKYLIAL